MTHTNGTGEIAYAVFCVCASSELVGAVMTAADQVPQAFFAGEFRDYFSGEKRPQFSLPIKQARACLAVVDFDRDVELALKTVERLHEIFSGRVRVIAVARELPAPLLLRAIRAGCSDFLPAPPGATELADAIRRFQQAVVVNPLHQASVGKVVAFFGAKGGVGTTTLAVHLAGYLIACHGKKTLLIDHKHQLGHVALYLGLKDTQYHFDELLKNVDRLDAELLTGFAIRHGNGLDVMASPEIATAAYESKRDDLERVMDFLRSEYDYILIDSSVEYQQTKMSIIGEADEVYLVSTPDVAALRDLARLVEHIGLSPSANGKLRLIVNRSTADDSFTPEQIQKAVRFPVSNSVPNNYGELLHAINQGVPISPERKSPFNDALATIAREIVHGNAPPAGPTVGLKTGSKLAFWR
jgi:pilus assembly protein CpaE